MNTILKNKTFLFRPCIKKDYWFVYNLLKRNMINYFTKHWGGWKPEVFRESFNENNITIIEYKKRRIGFFDRVLFKNHIYINNIQISSLYQGKGLGNYILTQIEKEAKKKKRKYLQLRVFEENPALKLYKRHGFTVKENDKGSLLMEKKA